MMGKQTVRNKKKNSPDVFKGENKMVLTLIAEGSVFILVGTKFTTGSRISKITDAVSFSVDPIHALQIKKYYYPYLWILGFLEHQSGTFLDNFIFNKFWWS